MSKEENLLELVQTNKVELVDSREASRLRKQAKDAIEELDSYKRRFSEQGDLVYECNCESSLPSCSYIHSVDSDRSPRIPNFCPLDGNGCRWKKVKSKPFPKPQEKEYAKKEKSRTPPA
jgi:hypothetical protein